MMRQIASVILIIAVLLSVFAIPVAALQPADQAAVTVLRAGGGSSSGGSSGGGGSSGSSHTSGRTGTGRSDPLSTLMFVLMGLVLSSASVIAFRLKLGRSAQASKRSIRKFRRKDGVWKLRTIKKQVKQTYYAVQKAWTKGSMRSAEEYMSESLYRIFEGRLSWMSYRNQRNVLKRIRLLRAIPVSIHDDGNDERDHIWFYIKGRMVDYTVDTSTDTKVDGSTFAESFVEYWQFVRTRDDRWVLNQILQQEEGERML